mmetsp:Transcript_32967/g.48369  ORF Transcript_32967/g.48369 Transcript_32967/m.48369 type:complete len:778 (+) Transcript_32967:148-2481(+)
MTTCELKEQKLQEQREIRPQHQQRWISSHRMQAMLLFKAMMIHCMSLKTGVCALSPATISARGRITVQQNSQICSVGLSSLTTTTKCRQHKCMELNSSGSTDNFEGDAISSSSENKGAIEVSEIDVRYGLRSPLSFDSSSGRYIPTPQKESSLTSMKEKKIIELEQMPAWRRKLRHSPPLKFYRRHIYPILHSSFLPEGVSPSYYRFIRWRIAQRFFNANVHVFGTQSLLLGLGVKSKSATASSATAALGLSAALTWVLKDALGKIVRMLWASRMGRKFDPDAKRWRFRSCFVFALGNGLEVTSYIYPQLFLLWATLANCCKQVSMLTSSATRNALYNSFKVGNRENIGDITAKGEAQIAVVDLLGIATGVRLSQAVGVSVKSVLTVWILLQAVEIFCMYHEIRSVIYSVLNYERLCSVVDSFLSATGGKSSGTTPTARTKIALKQTEEDGEMIDNVISSFTDVNSTKTIPTPDETAYSERIFLPPNHLARRATAFGSIGRARLSPDELDMLISDIFRGDKFFLVAGEDVKNDRRWKRWLQALSRNNYQDHKILSTLFRKRWKRIKSESIKTHTNGENNVDDNSSTGGRAKKRGKKLNAAIATSVEKARRNCHIVLHADANNVDIVKSTLALMILRRKLAKRTEERWLAWEDKCFDRGEDFDESCLSEPLPSSPLRTSDCLAELRESRQEANTLFSNFLTTLTDSGWLPPARFMFGRVSMRAEWPIQKKRISDKGSSAIEEGIFVESEGGDIDADTSQGRTTTKPPLASLKENSIKQ